jgi:hypothetical protein
MLWVFKPLSDRVPKHIFRKITRCLGGVGGRSQVLNIWSETGRFWGLSLAQGALAIQASQSGKTLRSGRFPGQVCKPETFDAFKMLHVVGNFDWSDGFTCRRKDLACLTAGNFMESICMRLSG